MAIIKIQHSLLVEGGQRITVVSGDTALTQVEVAVETTEAVFMQDEHHLLQGWSGDGSKCCGT